ncbi:22807_t:CDS:2, partial [Gigaspora margarita]
MSTPVKLERTMSNVSIKSVHRDSIHLSPQIPRTPRRRRSRSPSRSRSRSRNSSKVSRHNTDALSNNHSKLTDSPTFLNVSLSQPESPTFLNVLLPQPDTGIENSDRYLSCSPPGHNTLLATESDTRGNLSAPPSLERTVLTITIIRSNSSHNRLCISNGKLRSDKTALK